MDMPEWLTEYWVYVLLSLLFVIGALVFISRRPKRRIDIEANSGASAQRTLSRNSGASDARPSPNPLPRFNPPSDGPVRRDNLLVIKGMGAIYASRLDLAGFMRFEQIAAWTQDQLPDIAALIGVSVEKVAQDQWIEQAKLLASERHEEFEAKYGKINPEELNRFKTEPHF